MADYDDTPAMRPETDDAPRQTLRKGLSTGACATAASFAAARYLLLGETPRAVRIHLPRGQQPTMVLEDFSADGVSAVAGIIKDAGDDPDATHGARLWVRLTLADVPGVVFHAGQGVGTVTRPGLLLPPGEPAINPVPRRMISEHLAAVAEEAGYEGGFHVTVGIDDGEAIATRTMNGRLGIVGGLSVLGTTGIVRPFSCSAYIASIHQSVDVARAIGLDHVAGCTGGTSEAFVRGQLGLSDEAIVEMGDMFGALLKYLRRNQLPRLTLASGFAKLSKFAAGHPDTHSARCSVDFEFLAEQAGEAGAGPGLQKQIRQANTSIQALEYCQEAGIALGDRVARLGLARTRRYLPEDVELSVFAVNRQGMLVGQAEDAA